MGSCTIDWIATGTMLSALFTLLLVILAAWAGWEARRAAKAAWADIGDREQRSIASQASKVYAFSAEIGGNARHLREPWITVTNGSDLPIYNVTATITEKYSGNSTEFFMRTVMPGETSDRKYIPVGLLTREWGWGEQFDRDNQRYYRMPDHAEGPLLFVTIDFCDAANRRWKRDSLGVLTRFNDVGDCTS